MFGKILRYGGTTLAGVALAGAVVWSGIVPTDASTTAAQIPQQGQMQDTAEPGFQGQFPDGSGRDRRDRRPHKGEMLVGALIRQTSEATELSVQEVTEQVRSGATLAEVAGDSADAVVDAVVAQAQERLDQVVENGRLTQERADEMIAQVTEQANQLMVDAELGSKINQRFDQVKDNYARAGLVATLADETDLTAKEIAQQLRDGASLAEIAADQGLSSEDLVNTAVDNFRTIAEDVVDDVFSPPANGNE